MTVPSGWRLFQHSSLPRCAPYRFVQHFENRFAACGKVVEIDHERPGALAGNRAVTREVTAGRFEIVGMGLELLPQVIPGMVNRWFTEDSPEPIWGRG